MINSASFEASGLSVSIGKRRIINSIDMGPLPAGTITALVGPNGAGKSTLLRGLAGLVPSRGGLWLGETDLQRLRPDRRGNEVAYMPQALPAGVELTVLEGVLAALKAAPLTGDLVAKSRIHGQAVEALVGLDIAHLAMERLSRLSGGQRQMAALAQAIARAPRLLLLDEPTSALDLRHQVEVIRAIGRMTATGCIVIIVLHDLSLAARWADQIVLLDSGAVVAAGSPAEVLTPTQLKATYGIDARVELCSRGRLQVLID